MNSAERFFHHCSVTQVEQLDSDPVVFEVSEKPRILLVGVGMMGREHLRVSSLLGWSSVHGIFDPDGRSVQQALVDGKSLFNAPLVVYSDLETACSDDSIDAIFICTPNHTHHGLLKIAISSGKPILLEKPMATTLSDAADIVDLSCEYPTFIQIGMQYRYKAQYVDAFHEVKKLGTVGAVKTITMCEYRPPFLDKVHQWNKFHRLSGGTLVEKCCHYFDLINLMAESRPVSVYASGGQSVNFLDFKWEGIASDIDDHAMVIINYENGVCASFTLNMFCQELYEELVVGGERGRVVASEHASFRPKIASKAYLQVQVPDHAAYGSVPVGYPKWIEESGHCGATFFEHVVFNRRLAGYAVDAATPEQALWSLIVASAAQHSIQTGCEVDVGAFCVDQQIGEFFEK